MTRLQIILFFSMKHIYTSFVISNQLIFKFVALKMTPLTLYSSNLNKEAARYKEHLKKTKLAFLHEYVLKKL